MSEQDGLPRGPGPSQGRPTRGQRALNWWESRPTPVLFAIAYPFVTVAIFAVHVAFFHRITVWRSLGYAVFEGMLVAGLIALATASEVARKRAGNDPGGPRP